MFKGTKLYSILGNKCPKCQKGRFFKTNNPYNLRLFDKINKECASCHESFTREPGFYIGSMYISYALSVAVMVIAFVTFVVLLDYKIEWVLGCLLFSYLLFTPVFFRLARLIWINIFVRYEKNKPIDQ